MVVLLLAFISLLAHAEVLRPQCELSDEADCSFEGANFLQLTSTVMRGSASHVGNVGSSKIPCYIHQTWKTDDMSKLENEDMQESVRSLQRLNPECKHKIWSDQDVDAFMKKNHPELYWAWPRLKPVERADLFRYAVVHKLGGFYADMDVRMLKPIREWEIPGDTELLVAYEIGWHLREENRDSAGIPRNELFEQWFFGSVPGHPVLKECLSLFETRWKWGVEDIAELTGPAIFSDAVHEHFWSAIANKTRRSVGEVVTSFAQKRAADSEEMMFPPGPGPEGSHVLILSPLEVHVPAAGGDGSAGDIAPDALIDHQAKGIWKWQG
mmetsp:Transcript_157688/g.278334  ORF Transcript_157688/g.278334 Transcript_157688/m.278334 type:complete len:325 (-) Transcript_157688:69-1043(-)